MTKERIKDAIYTRRYIYNFHYPLIWVTKYRNQTFTNPRLVEEMKLILAQIALDNDIKIDKMEVMSDHVHVLVSFHQARLRLVPSKCSKDVVLISFSNSTRKLDNLNIGADIYGRLVTI